MAGACECENESSGFIILGGRGGFFFLTRRGAVSFSERTLLHEVSYPNLIGCLCYL